MQAEYPMSDFEEFLKKQGLGESSRRQVLLATRRALKHLGTERLHDRSELSMYRLSIGDATDRLFGYSWKKLKAYMAVNGEDLPDLERAPVFKMVHPLWADLTDLTVYLNINRIETLRWGLAEESGPEIYLPARRAFEFITGRPPLPSDWLLPRDAAARDPMPAWMIDAILRTNATEGSRDVELAAFRLLENVTKRGISAAELRALWSAVERALGSISGRRRLVRVGVLLENPETPWTPFDQDKALKSLGRSPAK